MGNPITNCLPDLPDMYEDSRVVWVCENCEQLGHVNAALINALMDMLSGWRYIRSKHGDLYGVGWDRAQEKAESALKLANSLPEPPK